MSHCVSFIWNFNKSCSNIGNNLVLICEQGDHIANNIINVDKVSFYTTTTKIKTSRVSFNSSNNAIYITHSCQQIKMGAYRKFIQL